MSGLCEDCRFAKLPTGAGIWTTCHRKPPPWPSLLADEGWCGEFRPVVAAVAAIRPMADELATCVEHVFTGSIICIGVDQETISYQNGQRVRAAVQNYRSAVKAAGG